MLDAPPGLRDLSGPAPVARKSRLGPRLLTASLTNLSTAASTPSFRLPRFASALASDTGAGANVNSSSAADPRLDAEEFDRCRSAGESDCSMEDVDTTEFDLRFGTCIESLVVTTSSSKPVSSSCSREKTWLTHSPMTISAVVNTSQPSSTCPPTTLPW